MSRPEHSSPLTQAARVLGNRPELSLLARALAIAQEIPNELPKHTYSLAALHGSEISNSPAMLRAMAFAALGAAVLESSGGDRELIGIGRALVAETLGFVKKHIESIAAKEVNELLVPIAVASHRLGYTDLQRDCLLLGETIIERARKSGESVTFGVSSFKAVALASIESEDCATAGLVLDRIMTPVARGETIVAMVDKVLSEEDLRGNAEVVKWVMRRLGRPPKRAK